jgi:head-tail adaptor
MADLLTSGELAQRVTIQTRTEAESHGTTTESWDTVVRARTPAKVRPLSGRDLERARQVDPRISHEVTLRFWRAYRTDLAGGRARLVYHPSSQADDDQVLEIVTPPIDVDSKHVALVMLCREAA